MKDAIIAGIISGIISPIIFQWLQHHIIWRSQKRVEIKLQTFIDAVTALSSYESDATDVSLQKDKPEYRGMRRKVELRPETLKLLERSRGMVRAFFSKEVMDKFEQALTADLSLENIPYIDFEEKRAAAIVAMAKALGIDNRNFCMRLK